MSSNSQIRLLLVAPDYFPAQGGVEKFVKTLADFIHKNQNYHIKILAGTRLQKEICHITQEVVDGIEIYRIPTRNPFGMDFPRNPLHYYKIVKLLKWADIIHLNDIRLFFLSSLFIKVAYKKSLIVTALGFIFHNKRFHLFKKGYMKFFSWARKYMDELIVGGKDETVYCQSQSIPARLIELGVDLSKYQQIIRSPVKGSFLYFGRIDTNKNLPTLIKNLAAYKNRNASFRLRICGSGELSVMTELKSTIEACNLIKEVELVGRVSDVQLTKELAEAELIFLPSTYESFGYTLVESLACGATVIAHKNDQFVSMLSDSQAAYLVDFSDVDEFCEKVELARQEFNPCRAAAYEMAKKYDETSFLVQYEDVYSRLLRVF